MTAKRGVVLIGASGHARAVADVIEAEGRYAIAGLIDSFQRPGNNCFGYQVLGGERDLREMCERLGVGEIFVAIGDNYRRQGMADRVRDAIPGVRLISCRHPSAIIGSDVQIGAGTVIMPGVVVVSGSRIEEGCLLNTAAVLDHDGVMERWSSLAPGVVTGGRLHLGERSAICLGAKVAHDIAIGRDTVIGAGAVVVGGVPSGVLAYGVPCRVVRTRAPDERYV